MRACGVMRGDHLVCIGKYFSEIYGFIDDIILKFRVLSHFLNFAMDDLDRHH